MSPTTTPSTSEPATHQLARGAINGAFEALARFITRFRFAVVAFWLLVVVLTSVALPSLSNEVNNENSAFLPASAPSAQATELGSSLFGGRHGSVIVIVASSQSPVGATATAALRNVGERVKSVQGVISVQDAGIAADGHAVELRVRVDVARSDIAKQKQIVGSLEGVLSHSSLPAGLQVHLAGQVATAVANQASSDKAGKQVQSYSIIFIIVLLALVFRAPLAAIITLLPSALALVISMRVIGELGAHGLNISSVTQVLLIVLLLGAGTDYGLFLVFRVREELREGHDPQGAVVRALVRVGESISASAGTVIIALLTLLLASFGLYHDLGAPLAVGVAVILLMGLTLLPALLAIFGHATFWPVKISEGQRQEGIWGRVARLVIRRPGATLAIGVVFFLALAAGALNYSSSGFGGATAAPAGSSAAAGNTALARHFPESSANPANLVFSFGHQVWQDPSALQRAYASLSESGAFTTISGPLDANGATLPAPLFAALHAQLGAPGALPVVEPPRLSVPSYAYNAYRASAQFVSPNGRVVQFEAALRAGPQQSTQALEATPHIRTVVTRAAASSGATRSGVAGEAAALYDISTIANGDLILIIPIAAVAITLLLVAVLRSLVAPIYLIVSVVLSYLAALGLATIVFVSIGGDRGLTFILPFLMFIFLLALGEDYNILVMSRIREEAQRRPLRDAVAHAISRTGSTVTSAGVILGGTFAVFGLFGGGNSGSNELQAIGFGLAAGILMDTFIVRTLLVPSAVILLGRYNWWPSAMGRRGVDQLPSDRGVPGTPPGTPPGA
ncbi:MAG: MMPL family transporter [Solirubrobacteraceae bacterium]